MKIKNLKTFFVVTLLSITCLGTFAACSLGESPTEAVSKALTATKAIDEVGMSNYFTYKELMNFDKTNENKPTTDKAKKAKEKLNAKLFFSKLNYKVISSSKDGDTAIVKTEITNTDMSSVMTEYFTEAMTFAMSNAFLPEATKLKQEDIDKKMEQTLISKLSKKDNKTVTTTVDIKLTKKDKKWKINMDKQLQNAITGGLSGFSQKFDEGNKTDKTPIGKLSEIREYIVSEIWNKGFSNVSSYLYDGTGNTGGSIDIAFLLSQLDTSYKKKKAYDVYVQGLDAAKFSNIKTIWTKLSTETDVIYSQIKKTKPVPKGTPIDTGKFSQYMDAFEVAVDAVK